MVLCRRHFVPNPVLFSRTVFTPKCKPLRIHTRYDGLGQTVAVYVGYDDDETAYAEADDVDGDTVLQQVEYAYDEAGRMTFVTSFERNHDAAGTGELTSSTALVSYVSSWFDALGRQTATADYGTYPAGQGDPPTRPSTPPASSDTLLVTTIEYDSAGNAWKVTDPNGREDRMYYDAAGRVVETILNYEDGSFNSSYPDEDVISSTDYNSAGQLWKQTDPLGNVTEYVYDDWGRLQQLIAPDPDGGGAQTSPVTEYEYDFLGRVVTVTDPLDNATAYEYDGLGRQTKITQPDPDGGGAGLAPWTVTTYNALGNVTSVTDRLGNGTTYEYNGWGLLATETDAESGVTSYTYDDQGRMLTLTDPESNVTEWTYDRLGRVVSETNELSDTREFVYDGGLLFRRIDRMGRVIEYAYDLFGRQIGEYWYADATAADNDPTHASPLYSIEHTYDCSGNILTVADDAASYTYTYDDLNRVLTETQTLDGLTPTIVFSYQYSAIGHVTQVACTIGEDDDFVTDYTYDNLYRVSSIQQQDQGDYAVAEKRIDLTYDAASQYATIAYYSDLDGGAGNLVMTATYVFDDTGRLTDLVYTDATPEEIREFEWIYDAAGRIIAHDSDIASEDVSDYGYDATNQLTEADYITGSDESYEYDSNGNRVLVDGADAYTTDENNQTTSDGTYTYEYDAEGNLILRYIDDDSSETLNTGDTDITEYTWDNRNRLTEVVHKDVFGGSTDWRAEYIYDALNHRIGALYDIDGDTDVDLEERYVWQGKNVALDFVDADGEGETESLELARRYLWGQMVDQLLAQETFDDGGVEDVLYPVRDNLGSTRSLVDYTGTITSTFSYDSFGNVSVLVGTILDTRYGYTCQEYDAITAYYQVTVALNYYDARWYDPTIGKFVSEDPIGYLAGMNLYRYVGNMPTLRFDPLGLFHDEVDIDGWLVFKYEHDITAEKPTCKGGKLAIKSKGELNLYFVRGKFDLDWSITASPNSKPKEECKFELGSAVFDPYWDWDVGDDFINYTIGVKAGTTNFNIDLFWKPELTSNFVIKDFEWWKPWTLLQILEWSAGAEGGFRPYAKFYMWNDTCCKCYTITAKAEEASFSVKVVPGRIAGAALVAAKVPGFVNGVGKVLGNALDDILKELPKLLPGT